MLLCQLALLQLGARILPLNPQLPESSITELTAGLAIDYMIDFTEEPLSLPNIKSLDYRAVITKSPNFQDDVTVAVPFMPLLPATLILTSGSTGLAKAVVHNIAAHLNSARGCLHYCHFSRRIAGCYRYRFFMSQVRELFGGGYFEEQD